MNIIKEIYRQVKNTVYNNENLSLPFLANYHNTELLTFFVYDGDYDDYDNLVITAVSRMIYVDLKTEEAEIIHLVDNKLTFPITIKAELQINIEEIDSLYDSYYNALERYFGKNMTLGELSKAFRRIVDPQFVEVYLALGATL